MKKALSLCLLLSLCAIPTSAITLSSGNKPVTNSGEEQRVPVTLQVEVPTFSVTVPTSLPVHVASDGTRTVATDAKIINNSGGAIDVKSISVAVDSDWDMVAYNESKVPTSNVKEFGLKINDKTSTNGGFAWSDFTIDSAGSGNNVLMLDYDVQLGTQMSAMDDEQLAEFVFTVAWH